MLSADSRILRDETDLNNLYDTLEAELAHGAIDVEWKEYKPKRTSLQNRWYWEILTQLEGITGNDKEALHTYFKFKFLGADEIEVMGQSMLLTRSTTKLNTKAMSEYIRSIELCASENGYELKYPNYWGEIQ